METKNTMTETTNKRKYKFEIDTEFANKKRHHEFGYNGVGELVFLRTYSRLKKDGTHETWKDTVERVVNCAYNIQMNTIVNQQKHWNREKGQKSGQEMYEKIYYMQVMPPGRALWAMDEEILEKKGGAPLNNCGFVSTENIDEELSEPFTFATDAFMCGTGIGFNIRGAGKIIINKPNRKRNMHFVEDSREGWVESIGILLDSYFKKGQNTIEFDYSKVRKEGEPLKTFGGISSGPQPLIDAHENIRKVLNKNANNLITKKTIVDIFNIIGKCVVSGGIRRTAEIALGDTSEEFINLKNYEKNPERAEWGWTSNNSIILKTGENFKPFEQLIIKNGEPGFCFVDNMQNYSRMNGIVDKKDYRAEGSNPCNEQTLENRETCILMEIPLNRQYDPNDETKTLNKKIFLRSCKYACLFAKTMTLVPTHWERTNEIISRNRRFGCSVTGIAQFLENQNINILKEWLEEGYKEIQYYDTVYSEWFGIPKSIKTTSVKPSGTISLLTGSTPGIHYPISRYYIRRVRMQHTSKLLPSLKKRGYNIIYDVPNEPQTVIIEFPVDIGCNIRNLKDVTMWEQIMLAEFMQRYWADNQVSVTVTFDSQTEGKHIANALNYAQYNLKGISFLALDNTAYKYAPYESISEDMYKKLYQNIEFSVPLEYTEPNVEINALCPESGCDTDYCLIKS